MRNGENTLPQKWREDSKAILGVNIKERLMPTIYGGIIGDMLGVPVEFKKRGLPHCHFLFWLHLKIKYTIHHKLIN